MKKINIFLYRLTIVEVCGNEIFLDNNAIRIKMRIDNFILYRITDLLMGPNHLQVNNRIS